MYRLILSSLCSLLMATAVYAADSLPMTYEIEPNNEPETALPITGAVRLLGDLGPGDQDGYLWRVDHSDSHQLWDITLHGQASQLTQLEVIRLIYAADGRGISKKEVLFAMGSRDGGRSVKAEDVLFEPGVYLIGVSTSQGDGTGYRVAIERADKLLAAPQKPYGKQSQALRLQSLRTMPATEEESWLVWPVTQKESEQRWVIEGWVNIGTQVSVHLINESGETLSQTESNRVGQFILPGLALSPGTYYLKLRGETGPYLRAVGRREAGQSVAGEEAEPNDVIKIANTVASFPVQAQAGHVKDRDWFAFSVDEALSGNRLSLSVTAKSPPRERVDLCLADADGRQLQCRSGKPAVVLSDLLLAPGKYYAEVVLRDKTPFDYELSLSSEGAYQTGLEAEPNDRVGEGVTLVGKRPYKGRFSGDERDHYQLRIAGEPELWRIQAIGAEVKSLTVRNNGGEVLAEKKASASSSRVTLDHLFLMPGSYHIAVAGSDADYRIQARPIGQPDPQMELEPNDTQGRAIAMEWDKTYKGLLADRGDRDLFRFHLYAEQRVALKLKPPPDSRLGVEVKWGQERVVNQRQVDPEQGFTYQSLLKPGSYTIRLHAQNPSDDVYELSVQHLPYFECGQSCSGIDMRLAPFTEPPAAFVAYEQKLLSELSIHNTGTEAVELDVLAHVSDRRWFIDLAVHQLQLAPGEQKAIPVSLLAPKAVSQHHPVRLEAAVSQNHQLYAADAVQIQAVSGAASVNPQLEWGLPESLLGGLNLAWQAMGSEISHMPDLQNDTLRGYGKHISRLFDGMVFDEGGISLSPGRSADMPGVTIKLDEEQAVPVQGFLLHPYVGKASPGHYLQAFEILLSEDGSAFNTVLAGELSAAPVEQAFVLDQPYPARYARLNLINNQADQDKGKIVLGEWKVLARPQWQPDSAFNLAAPALGGHVVRFQPRLRDRHRAAVLTAEDEVTQSIRLSESELTEWVVAFHELRSARLETIRWHPSRHNGQQAQSVEIAISEESPFGPWQEVGQWTIQPDQVQQWVLEGRPWARFVRFTVKLPDDSKDFLPPGQIEIFEQTVGDGYYSILGEWGFSSQEAIRELSQEENNKTHAFQRADTRDQAETLIPAEEQYGQVELDQYSHWYHVQVPEASNALNIGLRSSKDLRVVVKVEDSAGEILPLKLLDSSYQHQVFQASVTPGASYWIEVSEPPRSLIVAWDTSGSVAPYKDEIYSSVVQLMDKVKPGLDEINLLPFGAGEPLLSQWYGEPYALKTLLYEYDGTHDSSAAEKSLAIASEALHKREGSQAIIVITDANTGYDPALWPLLERVRPRIFSIGVAMETGWGDPSLQQNLLQSWASVNHGFYSYAFDSSGIADAMDRASAELTSPAPYYITSAFDTIEPPGPGTLQVTWAESALHIAPFAAAAFVIDASGSMWNKLDGQFRIDIAKQALIQTITNNIPQGMPVVVRAFGHRKPRVCDTAVLSPLAPLSAEELADDIAGIQPQELSKTPLADSIAKLPEDMQGVQGPVMVIVLTDGEETCDGNPRQVIADLKAQGFDINLNIIGFAIDDQALEQQFSDWAKLGNGSYFSARDQDALTQAIQSALSTTYALKDSADVVIAEGLVGGESISVPAGQYLLELNTSAGLHQETLMIPPEELTRYEVIQ